MPMDREPHIGEYDTKTNAIGGHTATPIAPSLGPNDLQIAVNERE
jgi:hypothetical protein